MQVSVSFSVHFTCLRSSSVCPLPVQTELVVTSQGLSGELLVALWELFGLIQKATGDRVATLL